ncbi:hypothetical protein AB5I41_01260 [Sphingomonas sp. MMS24-JH45]
MTTWRRRSVAAISSNATRQATSPRVSPAAPTAGCAATVRLRR